MKGAMKTLFLASVAGALLAVGGSAQATDILPAYKAPPPAPRIVACPTCNWTGFYIGINGGGSIATVDSDATLSTTPIQIASDRRALMGGLIGGQAGFNWQFGAWVFGVEGDGQWTNERDTLGALSFSEEMRIKDLFTVRGRLGWAHDCWLWYVTGGGAWAQVDSQTLTTFASSNFSTTKSGWTVGTGVETSWAGTGWSAKLEYLWADLGSINRVFTTPTATFESDNQIREHIIRVGINYRFNWGKAPFGKAPVVASY